MRRNFAITLGLMGLAVISSACYANGGGPMGGGSMGGGFGAGSSSPQAQAVDAYNAGVKEVDRARAYENDAAGAATPEKHDKAIEKAQKAYAAGLERFQKAVDKNAALFQAWNYVGFCQRHLGHYDAALTAYDQAIKLNPRYAEAYEYRAEAYLGLNRVEDAKAAYMLLFASTRPLADQLLTSMHRWIEQRQQNPQGVGSDDLAAFAKWVDERATIAQQTAALWPQHAGRARSDWN